MDSFRGTVTVCVTEGVFTGEESNGEKVYGISLVRGDDERHIDDLSTDRSAVELFAKRLSAENVCLDSLYEIADDFLTELYGIYENI